MEQLAFWVPGLIRTTNLVCFCIVESMSQMHLLIGLYIPITVSTDGVDLMLPAGLLVLQ